MANKISARAAIEREAEKLTEPIAAGHGVRIYDVEYVKEGANWYLRVYADKEGGINIDDCVLISRALEAKLDEEDLIKDAYILEVSSPGLGRPLKKDRDFERNLGKAVEIKLYKPLEGCKEFEGILKDYSRDDVRIETGAREDTFSRKDIAVIRQAIEF